MSQCRTPEYHPHRMNILQSRNVERSGNTELELVWGKSASRKSCHFDFNFVRILAPLHLPISPSEFRPSLWEIENPRSLEEGGESYFKFHANFCLGTTYFQNRSERRSLACTFETILRLPLSMHREVNNHRQIPSPRTDVLLGTTG
jgi:hypothetical protein